MCGKTRLTKGESGAEGSGEWKRKRKQEAEGSAGAKQSASKAEREHGAKDEKMSGSAVHDFR